MLTRIYTVLEAFPAYHLIAFAVGFAVGLSEIITRYPGAPKAVFRFFEVYAYCIVNGLAALLAYTITDLLDISVGAISMKDSPFWLALLSGVGAMVILRSSVATIGKGEKAVSAGAARIIEALLAWAERRYDQKQSALALPKIESIMKNVVFSQVVKDLPLTCFNLMQGIPKDEQELIGKEVQRLADAEISSDNVKCLNLGIVLFRVTGIELLESSVKALKEIDKDNLDTSAYGSKMEKIRRLKGRFGSGLEKEESNVGEDN